VPLLGVPGKQLVVWGRDRIERSSSPERLPLQGEVWLDLTSGELECFMRYPTPSPTQLIAYLGSEAASRGTIVPQTSLFSFNSNNAQKVRLLNQHNTWFTSVSNPGYVVYSFNALTIALDNAHRNVTAESSDWSRQDSEMAQVLDGTKSLMASVPDPFSTCWWCKNIGRVWLVRLVLQYWGHHCAKY
jgi:hypothetical protein